MLCFCLAFLPLLITSSPVSLYLLPLLTVFFVLESYSLCDSNDLPLCEAYWREDFDTLSPESLSMPLTTATAEQSVATSQSSTPSHPHVNGHGAGPTDHSWRGFFAAGHIPPGGTEEVFHLLCWASISPSGQCTGAVFAGFCSLDSHSAFSMPGTLPWVFLSLKVISEYKADYSNNLEVSLVFHDSYMWSWVEN